MDRVIATEVRMNLIEVMQVKFSSLMFRQIGGRSDGSAPERVPTMVIF